VPIHAVLDDEEGKRHGTQGDGSQNTHRARLRCFSPSDGVGAPSDQQARVGDPAWFRARSCWPIKSGTSWSRGKRERRGACTRHHLSHGRGRSRGPLLDS
jgi:hypothetical protein